MSLKKIQPKKINKGLCVVVNIYRLIKKNYIVLGKLTSTLSLKCDIFHIYNVCSFECPSVVDIGSVLSLWLYLTYDFT